MNTLHFERSDVKKPLMTALYGKVRMMGSLMDQNPKKTELLIKTIQEKVATVENEAMAITMAEKMLRNSLREIAPMAVTAMEMMQEFHEDKMQKNYGYILPNGYDVQIVAYTKVSIKIPIYPDDVDSLTNEITYETLVVNDYEDVLGWRGMSANIFHSIDGFMIYRVQTTLAGMGINMLSIHDAYLVAPQHVPMLKHVYKLVLLEVRELDLLSDIMNQMGYIGNFREDVKARLEAEHGIQSRPVDVAGLMANEFTLS